MNKPKNAIPRLVLLSFLVSLSFLTVNAVALGQSQPGTKERKRISEITRTLRVGDEAAIRKLTELVLLVVRSDPAPQDIPVKIRERIVRAEINYQNGQNEGIPEDNIVRVVNYIAKEFDAPVYAQAQLQEVSELRAGEAYPMFHSLAPELARTEAEQHPRPHILINPKMSAIEAVYFTLSLIFEKKSNACYQLTSEERSEVKTVLGTLEASGITSQKERGRMLLALCNREIDPDKLHLTPEELAAELKQYIAEQRSNSRVSEKPYLSLEPSSGRYREMQAVFKRAFIMNPEDALQLMNKCLDLLGFEK